MITFHILILKKSKTIYALESTPYFIENKAHFITLWYVSFYCCTPIVFCICPCVVESWISRSYKEDKIMIYIVIFAMVITYEYLIQKAKLWAKDFEFILKFNTCICFILKITAQPKRPGISQNISCAAELLNIETLPS